MKPFSTIVYIRIISLRWKFDDHPLVEYPLNTPSSVLSLDTSLILIIRKIGGLNGHEGID